MLCIPYVMGKPTPEDCLGGKRPLRSWSPSIKPPLPVSPSATSTHLLKPSRGGDSITAAGSLLQHPWLCTFGHTEHTEFPQGVIMSHSDPEAPHQMSKPRRDLNSPHPGWPALLTHTKSTLFPFSAPKPEGFPSGCWVWMDLSFALKSWGFRGDPWGSKSNYPRASRKGPAWSLKGNPPLLNLGTEWPA